VEEKLRCVSMRRCYCVVWDAKWCTTSTGGGPQIKSHDCVPRGSRTYRANQRTTCVRAKLWYPELSDV